MARHAAPLLPIALVLIAIGTQACNECPTQSVALPESRCPNLQMANATTLALDTSPRWSPSDENLIAYVHLTDTREPEAAALKQILLIDLESRSTRYVCAGELAEWSPDGGTLVVAREDSLGRSQAVLTYLNGDPDRQLTHSDIDCVSVSWAPDGKRIAVGKRPPRGGQGSIWIVDLASRQERFLTTGITPRWAPSGEMIACGPTLRFVSVDQPDSVRTFPQQSRAAVTQWSRDGQRLYFVDADQAYRSTFVLDIQTGTVSLILPGIVDATLSGDEREVVFSGALLATNRMVLIHEMREGGCAQITSG